MSLKKEFIGLDSISGLFMLIMLEHLSSGPGLCAYCLWKLGRKDKTSLDGNLDDHIQVTLSPQRKHTLITCASGQVINIFCIYRNVTSDLLIINCLNATRNDGVINCIYSSFIYVSLKEFGMVGSDKYTWV